jgi:uncharacterized OsmC-like protein
MEAVKQEVKRNGVDVSALHGVVGAVQENPKLARNRFRARNQWIAGAHNRSTIQGFYAFGQEDTSRAKPFILDSDQPEVLLGDDNGPNPVEYVLHSLAACLTTTIVYHAAARGITIESVESTVEGNLDAQGFLGLSEDGRTGYEGIRVSFRIKSDATAEQLKELTAYSVVLDTLTQGVPVDLEIECL